MPIVSSEFKQRDRGNNRLSVREIHTDHNGKRHFRNYQTWVSRGVDETFETWDAAQALIDNAALVDGKLIEAEKYGVKLEIMEGASPASITTEHITTTQKAKQIIRGLMAGDPEKLLQTATYIDSLSNAQIENHFSSAQRIRIRSRVNYILTNQSVFAGDEREDI